MFISCSVVKFPEYFSMCFFRKFKILIIFFHATHLQCLSDTLEEIHKVFALLRFDFYVDFLKIICECKSLSFLLLFLIIMSIILICLLSQFNS